jgi:hypothetical protein
MMGEDEIYIWDDWDRLHTRRKWRVQDHPKVRELLAAHRREGYQAGYSDGENQLRFVDGKPCTKEGGVAHRRDIFKWLLSRNPMLEALEAFWQEDRGKEGG